MKTRIISALVALVIAIVVLILANTPVLDLVLAGLSVGALYELFKAMGLVKYMPECGVCFGYSALDIMIGMVHRQGVLDCLNTGLFGFFAVMALLLLYLKNHDNYNYSIPFTFLGLTLGVTYSFACLQRMPMDFPKFGVFAIVLTLAGAWLADSGAQLVADRL